MASLVLSVAGGATSANLSSPVQTNWVEWNDGTGSGSTTPNNSRSGGSGAITCALVGTHGGTFTQYNGAARTISWSDGTPTGSGSAAGGVYNNSNDTGLGLNTGDGYSITFPADTTSRTAKVYLSNYQSGATVVASISDGSTGNQTNSTLAGNTDGIATITYAAASAGQTMTVTVTVPVGTVNAGANVALSAASFLVSGGSGTFGTTESSAGTTAQDDTVIFTKPAAESSAGTTAQTATATLTAGTSESSVSTTAQDDTISLSTGTSETSAATTVQDATVAVPAGVSESSVGTTAQDSTVTLTVGVTESSAGTTIQDDPSSGSGTFGTIESSAGTTSQDATVTVSAGVSESSGGTTAQTAAVTLSEAVSETSAGSTTQNDTVALSASVAESSAGTTAQDQTGSQTFSVTEASVGTTTQDGTVGTAISRGVTESSAGTTSQGATIAPPAGNGASAVRRWLIQYYTDYQEKRKKDEVIKELSKEVLQASAGVVTPKMVRERAPTPVVTSTIDAAALARKAQQLREERRIQAQINALMESQKALAMTPSLRVDDLHLRFEQGEEEDLLLLSSIL